MCPSVGIVVYCCHHCYLRKKENITSLYFLKRGNRVALEMIKNRTVIDRSIVPGISCTCLVYVLKTAFKMIYRMVEELTKCNILITFDTICVGRAIRAYIVQTIEQNRVNAKTAFSLSSRVSMTADDATN